MKNLIIKSKKNCLKSNKDILVKKLAIQTFGNASQRINDNLFVIKPSGINLKKIRKLKSILHIFLICISFSHSLIIKRS